MRVPRRPRVAIVSLDVLEPGRPRGLLSRLIQLEHDRIDFVVLARELAPVLRPLVEWRRVPALPGLRPGVLSFLLTGTLRLAGVRADLVHVNCGLPLVLNRSDLVWNHFLLSEFEELRDTAPFGGSVLGPPVRKLALATERFAYSRTRILAVVSEGAAGAARRHHPDPRVEVIPLPIDTTRFRPDPEARRQVREAAGVGDDETIALIVCRETGHKGVEIAIDSLGRAAEHIGPVRLWVAGIPPPHQRLEALARAAGLDGRLELLGYRLDVERIYQAADLLVMPSLYENFSRSMLEAAATELPMIVTPVHGVRELVGDDEAGLVVERNVAAVTEAVIRLARDPDLRAELGRAGRRRALDYTPERNNERILALYRELLPPELARGLAPRSYDPA